MKHHGATVMDVSLIVTRPLKSNVLGTAHSSSVISGSSNYSSFQEQSTKRCDGRAAIDKNGLKIKINSISIRRFETCSLDLTKVSDH
jgi:hypothetical protein